MLIWRSAPRVVACAILLTSASVQAETPQRVLFMIGDGMGLNHVKAGGMFLHGAPGTLSFESLPYQAQVMTYSASDAITDSAAAATAMATGNKVNNGVISLAYPGDGHALLSLLELYKSRGVRTGLVTSDVMTGATPAAFGAHEISRNNTSQIAGDYLGQSRPNILLGGGATGMTPTAATAAGYTVVTTRAGMQAVNTTLTTLLSGQFGSGVLPYEYDGMGNLPHLSEMLATALDILDNDPAGFFLMVEGGNIDHAAHSNDITRNVHEVVEFQNTVQAAMNWAAGRTDTLIIVTADHETGGMSNPINNGQGNIPTVTWSTTGHTNANVGAWAWGVNAQYVTGTLNNDLFFRIIAGPEPTLALMPTALSQRVAWAHNPPPGTDSFTVRNAGMGTIDYSITSDAAWVAPSPNAGSCTLEIDTIGLIYDTDALAVGTHIAHLEVSSGQTSSQTFTLTLTVDPAPGDFNADGDIDQEDFGHLQACFAASGMIAPACQDADLNHAGGVDPADLTIMLRCWSGADRPVNPVCVE